MAKMKLIFFIISVFIVLPMCLCQDEKTEDYIYHEEKLLLARDFNQSCEHEGQCSDHRLSCDIEEYTLEKRCVCVKYHTWDKYSQQCLVAENMTDMLSHLIEQYDAQADEVQESKRIFVGMLIAGFLVLGIGIVMAIVCTFIACYRPSSKVNTEYQHVCPHRRCSNLRNQPSSSGSSRPISPRREGTVDFIPGVMDLSVVAL